MFVKVGHGDDLPFLTSFLWSPSLASYLPFGRNDLNPRIFSSPYDHKRPRRCAVEHLFKVVRRESLWDFLDLIVSTSRFSHPGLLLLWGLYDDNLSCFHIGRNDRPRGVCHDLDLVLLRSRSACFCHGALQKEDVVALSAPSIL